MKPVFSALVLIGTVLGFGELIWARYIAGDTLTQATLYDRDSFLTPVSLNLSPDQLPLRLNMKISGWQSLTGTPPTARYALFTHQRQMLSARHFTVDGASRRKFILAGIDGQASASSSHESYAVMEKTYLLSTAVEGIETLSIIPTEENSFITTRIEADIIVNARPVNWWLFGGGLAVILIGLIGRSESLPIYQQVKTLNAA